MSASAMTVVVVVFVALGAASAFGPVGPKPNKGKAIQDFTCNKQAFYPTVSGGSGVRTVAIPMAMCSKIADADMILEALCCANTHVTCTDQYAAPTLISYDGSHYNIANSPATVLQSAYSRLCNMMMADKCGDCKKTDCSLFTAIPPPKACYGKTYTDHPDGSGFHNKTAVTALQGPGHASHASQVAAVKGTTCRPVQPVTDGFNSSEYTRATWYVQQQQVTGYQAKENLYCVAQTLADEGAKVPFFSGKVITVYNFATAGMVNGPPKNTANETKLCARQPDPTYPAAIINAPCFLPNILAGDYWVIAIGPNATNYEWAIISAGQPSVQYKDGCTTKTTGTNGAGLWLFTRQPVVETATVDMMRQELVNKGYALDELIDVPQQGCTYKGAYIKP